jgi:hypothetical protein
MASSLWRGLVVAHRYLGIAVGLMMFVWFGSGIVMMYVGYPELSEQDRLHSLSKIRWGACCNLADVAIPDDQQFGRAEVESLLGVPILRLARPPLPDVLIDLAAGRSVDSVDAAAAEAIARDAAPRILGRPAALVDAADIESDAWTIGLGRREGELFRFSFDDPGRSMIYVSPAGRVVLRTTASERFWNWFGAIPHWLYLAPLRSNSLLWSRVVIWTSILGTALTVLGLCIGVAEFRRGKEGRLSPHRSVHLWHHLAGLIFGVFALTWVFSGLLSMNPWGFLESRSGDERARLQGPPLRWSDIRRSLPVMQNRPVADVSLAAIPLAGHLYWLATAADGTVSRWDEAGHAALLTPNDLAASAARLAGAVSIREQGMLNQDDNYYFSHDWHRATLPVYRVVLDDAAGTRYYLDPASSALVQRVDGNGRWHRWLYGALHRLDFAAWLRTRPLWDAVMLVLMAGGLVLSATGSWLALRRLWADMRKMFRRPPASTHPNERTIAQPPAA